MKMNPVHLLIVVSGFYLHSPVFSDQTDKLNSPPPGPYISKKLAEKLVKEQIFFNNQSSAKVHKKPAHLDQYPDIIGVDKEKPKMKPVFDKYPELEKATREKAVTKKTIEYEKVKDSDSLYLFPKMEEKPKANKNPGKQEIEAIFHPLEAKKEKPSPPASKKQEQQHAPASSDNYQNFWDIQPEEETKPENLNQYPPMTE